MISLSINFLIRSFFVFLIAYLWASFFFRDFFLSVISAFLITVVVNCILGFFQNKRVKRQRLTKKEREERFLHMLQLRFLTQIESQELLQKALRALGSDAQVFSYFHTEPTTGDIARCIRQNKGKKTIIAASSFHPQVMQFAATVDVEVVLLNEQEVYAQLLKPAEVFPQILFRPKSKASLTLAMFKGMMLNRARTRGYVFIGIIILLTSFLVAFPLYYIIFATLLFGMAVASYFFPETKNLSF